MSRNILTKSVIGIILLLIPLAVNAQEQEQKSPEEMAQEQALKFEEDLSLLPHQTFYIDSILQHDMRAMHDEMMEMRKSGTQEYTVYKQIQDKWVAQIDSSFKKVLDEEQWIMYLKATGKYKKDKAAKKERRDKRN